MLNMDYGEYARRLQWENFALLLYVGVITVDRILVNVYKEEIDLRPLYFDR